MVALQQRGPDTPVSEVMRKDFLALEANEMSDAALACLLAAECCATATVMHRDALVGLLTAENVNEFMLIVSALGDRHAGKAESV